MKLFLLWLVSQFAWAQDNEFKLPEVIYEAPVLYPEDAVEQLQQASVRLKLVVLPDGTPVDIEVVDSPDDAFSRAAIEAMGNYRFEPATVDGDPVASTIEYVLNFTLELQPVLSIQGRVLEAGIRQPLANTTIELTGPDGAVAYTRTDASGAFALYDLAPGPWSLTVVAPGLRSESSDVVVQDGQVPDLTFYPVRDRAWEEDADEVIEVVYESEEPEVDERVISTQRAMALPGTNGDILKAVQNFPGVARPPLGIGQIIIRGTAPEDSSFFLDGQQIPLVFHFSGLSTVLNGDSLESIGFLNGNFGVRYGNTLGGIVDLKTTSQLPERSRGYVSIDVYQSALFVEQKIGERTALTLSGRRSYLDAFLGPILSSATGRSFQAPVYWDVQARMLHRTDRDRIDAMFLFSDDRFAISSEDGETTESGIGTQFIKGRLLWERRMPGNWWNELHVLVGPDEQSFLFDGSDPAYERQLNVQLREEIRMDADDNLGLGWRAGVDLQIAKFDFDYTFEGFGDGEPERAEGWRYLPSLYAENTWKLGPATLIPGLRMGMQFIDDEHVSWAIDPRVKAAIDVGPTTRIIGATGLYSQYALPREVLEASQGNPDLRPETSWQNSIAVKQEMPYGQSIQLTGFYNRLFNLISGREDRFEFFSGPPLAGPKDEGPYANDGKGDIYGVELSYRYEGKRAIAWLTGTWTRSFRQDRPGEESEVFAFDQPLSLNVLGNYKLPRQWTVGGRVRVGSGNPYTPVSNRAQNAADHGFVPIYRIGEVARVPTFWSIDIRVDKEWTFKKWALTAYLDIQNVTNNQNPEIIGYSYDYSEEDPISGLPILPAFGLKGAW